MNNEALKKGFGSDYPASVIIKGIRMPLINETRFSRYYRASDPKHGGCAISRFMDGSASITSVELERDWVTWTHEQRMDFCGASAWLHRQADFGDMLRFIVRHGTPDHWSSIAQSVAAQLPSDEAFSLLRKALHPASIGKCANISQAIATTNHPEAEITLRQHLQAVWEHPALWDDDKFRNRVAFDAITCISHLIELGASPSDFEDQVHKLLEHVCPGTRNSCRSCLSKYYSWLT